MLKTTLIAAALIAASAATFAQTTATPAPAKPVTAAAPAPASEPAKPAAAQAAATPAASAAKTADASPAVKKSKKDICHDESSPGYKATKNFKPFATMDECIKSGGRAPKAAEPKAKK